MTRHLLATLALLGLAACSQEAEAPAARAPAAEAAPPATAATTPPPKYREVEAPGAAKEGSVPFRSDAADVVLAPRGAEGDRLEYKVRMKAGDTLTYAWEAPEAEAFWHEFHGHTEDTVAFYEKAEGTKHSGVLTAPFDGIHGWYFENRTPRLVVVRLRMGGFYELVPKED
jgi:hypothetical protein